MFSDGKLLAFLLDAKRKTYAAQDNDNVVENVSLPGAKQLEYSSGNWFYRDIYFGLIQFTGQETVSHKNVPVWAMSYSGGIIGEHVAEEIQKLYSFLQDALRLVSGENPFRGPPEFLCGNLAYQSRTAGSLERFEGQEKIFANRSLCYSLNYAGGRVL